MRIIGVINILTLYGGLALVWSTAVLTPLVTYVGAVVITASGGVIHRLMTSRRAVIPEVFGIGYRAGRLDAVRPSRYPREGRVGEA